MSITKNHQSHETLLALAAAAFPHQEVSTITELTEGMFNAAYRVDFADGSASILKIAAASKDGLLSNEIDLMQAEVAAMELAQANDLPHVARVQYSDFSRTRCDGTYFFMEAIRVLGLSECIMPPIVAYAYNAEGSLVYTQEIVKGQSTSMG